MQVGVVLHLTIPYFVETEETTESTTDEEAEVQKEKCESSPAVTAIGVYIRRSHEKFLIGYDNGEVQYPQKTHSISLLTIFSAVTHQIR